MTIRPAVPDDAVAIAGVHVAAWRSAYAGLLPAGYLAGLSVIRHAARHDAAIRAGRGVLVAEAEGEVVGFCTVGQARTAGLGDGEIETLYVLDDHRDGGLGRALLCAGAGWLEGRGCGSAFLWVLEGNPSRFFYARMGGKPVRRDVTHVARQAFGQVAYAWDPIARLSGMAQA